MTDSAHPDTQCIHGGSEPLEARFGLNTPVVTSSAFDYRAEGMVRYPRYLNTLNHDVVAARLAALEGADAGVVTGSGMGAISALFLTLMRPGDHAVLLAGLYGGTTDLVEGLLKSLGMTFSQWDGSPNSLSGLINETTKLIYVESPTNPLMQVIDLEAVAGIAQDHGIASVIDNTFATPILQRPIKAGFDLVVHSGTKYLSGHSDLLCGAVVGSQKHVDHIRPNALRLGSSLNGPDLYLLDRSLKTLAVRIRQQTANAGDLAGKLADANGISAVYYPGLNNDPGHALATRQMNDFGAMLSFRLADQVDPEGFLDRLQLIHPAVSLGGVESTICQPSRTSHAKLAPETRERLGIDDRLMRLSVGVEAVEDLWGDLESALAG